jgi:SAM-dependent methyltransferase
MTVQALREVVSRLAASATAASSIGAVLQARASGIETPAAVRAHLDDIVDSLGLKEAVQELDAEAIGPILGELRVQLLAAAARVGSTARSAGWQPLDPEMLHAAGDVSAGFPALLGKFVPLMDGLRERLAGAEARFLDVGVGVAALAIEMARRCPSLRVVGIDVWAPSLALAHQNVKRADMDGRIELREQAVQHLSDAGLFDLAWIPSAFIPRAVIPEALQRVRRSLRSGGWLLFGFLTTGTDRLSASLTRLRAAEWGSEPWAPSEVAHLLEQSGFEEIRTLPSPPASAAAFLAARAP